MSATVKNIDDLNGLNIKGLKDFLRARDVCTTGVKKDLLRRALRQLPSGPEFWAFYIL